MTPDFPEQSPAAPISSQHSALFRRYVQKSARAALARLQQAGTTFPVEVRDRALHVLSFALQVDEAWPAARDLLLALAPKMEMAGYRDDWLPYLQQGLASSRQANDPLAAAELQLQIGHLYRLLSQFEQARQTLEASAVEFATLGNANGQARALNQLAHMAWHQRRYQEAHYQAMAALNLLPNSSPEKANSFSTLGLVAASWRQWQEAKHYFEKALQIHTDNGDQRRIAWDMQHLGNVLRNQGDYTQAVQYYENAIQVLTEIQDLRNCAITQMELGIFYWLMAQPTRALVLYMSAETFFRKSRDFLNLAKILTNKGLTYLTLCEWQQAIWTFIDSAALYKNLNDLYGQLNALDGLGLAYTGAGTYNEAIAVFEVALEQLPVIKDDPGAKLLEEELTMHQKQAQEKRECQNESS